MPEAQQSYGVLDYGHFDYGDFFDEADVQVKEHPPRQNY